MDVGLVDNRDSDVLPKGWDVGLVEGSGRPVDLMDDQLDVPPFLAITKNGLDVGLVDNREADVLQKGGTSAWWRGGVRVNPAARGRKMDRYG